MTYQSFISNVIAYRLAFPRQRLGQAMWNAIVDIGDETDWLPVLADAYTDPFHTDKNINAFCVHFFGHNYGGEAGWK